MSKPNAELFFNISTSLFAFLESNLQSDMQIIVNSTLDNMTENVYLFIQTDDTAREDKNFHYGQIALEFYCNNNKNFITEFSKVRNYVDNIAFEVLDYYNEDILTKLGTVTTTDIIIVPLSNVDSYRRRAIQIQYKFISKN